MPDSRMFKSESSEYVDVILFALSVERLLILAVDTHRTMGKRCNFERAGSV
jgi:hypothetical protein